MPHDIVSNRLRNNAKSMRRQMTDAELKLWNELRAHRLMGLGFRRQFPIDRYIVDFACAEKKLIVEVDGTQHAEDGAAAYDANRTAYLQRRGWTILRFWNDDILKSLDAACQQIIPIAGLATPENAMPIIHLTQEHPS